MANLFFLFRPEMGIPSLFLVVHMGRKAEIRGSDVVWVRISRTQFNFKSNQAVDPLSNPRDERNGWTELFHSVPHCSNSIPFPSPSLFSRAGHILAGTIRNISPFGTLLLAFTAISNSSKFPPEFLALVRTVGPPLSLHLGLSRFEIGPGNTSHSPVPRHLKDCYLFLGSPVRVP